jgi:hypothetical protein
VLVFWPICGAELRALADGGVLTGTSWSATPAFRDTFGLGVGDDEDAERTALYLAGLVALRDHGRRLVAVAELPAADSGDHLGAVAVDRLGLADVTALFADAPSAKALVDAAGAATAGLALEDAWDNPAHEALLAEADLLWYGPQEWAALVQSAR